ncbi:PheS-related mystery ligase SrmL [Kitasatospora griseola]|uniref:PheS-related mystery ligase SrmL n=1 Tax=Kitasatospora griseola TaxID=2064 RepID=UPI0037F51E30
MSVVAPVPLSADQLARDLAVRDLTDPAAGPHAVQLLVDRAADALSRHWSCPVRVHRGERTVTVADNYDHLNYRADDVTRDTRYTRYVDGRRMLRSHSSALVPGALRALAAGPAGDSVLLVCPGLVYRRDSIDRLHTGTPHQLDLWYLTRRRLPAGPDDLTGMIAVLAEALLPGAEYRTEERVHPYTLAGRQLDVRVGEEWVEVAECGLAHPEVLAGAGLGPEWSGLALGMGLDRVLMLLKGIPDIRILRSTDPAVAVQLTDLAPYRPVSALPAVRRDLSVAVDRTELAEDLGDRVRDALGPDADCVETVEILSSTPCRELPPQALTRLGARPDQYNLLVRVVLRHLHRTLTDSDANALRDRVYAALHQGAAHQWATTAP